MSASTIFFNGRLISIPGSYSEVDPSGLEGVGLSATGIVACIGEAVGGKPWSAVGDNDVKANLQVATNPQKPFEYFREGDLKEAAPLLFGPSNDADIPGGAQEVVFVKTNPAAKSAATFDNSDGNAVTITSADYGHFTTQIKVAIGAGTVKGKLVTVTFEAIEEVFDDVGGDEMFKAIYAATTPANGYSTITLEVKTTGLEAAFTAARAGLDSDITNQVTATQAVELLSDNAGDAQTVTLYGLDTSNAAQSELLTVNGTSVVTGTATWNEIHGAIISAAPAGTVTIRNLSAGTTITTLLAGTLTRGLHVFSDVSVANAIVTLVAGGASTAKLVLVGKNNAGATQLEAITLNGTTAVPGTATWSSLTYIAAGGVAAATTTTTSGVGVSVPNSGSPTPTLQKAADRFNSTPGFTFTLITGRTKFLLSDLDIAAATSAKSPTEPIFYANLALFIETLNLGSQLIVASKATPGTGFPDNTTADVFLAGGHEGSTTPGQEGTPTSTFADWQGAINLLTKVRVNTIVVTTHDPAVHAAVLAHTQYMAGPGRSERDAFLGVRNAADTGLATKTEVKAQIVDLNNRNIRVWAQNVERYNTLGAREVMQPKMGAAILAGMQAGSALGTPLTHKYMNTLSLEQDTTWNPTDDAEEMIQAGLVFAEVVDGVGRRVVRNVTTHLTDSNMAYTEGSVNEAVNFAVYDFRTEMERAVGKAGFLGTVQAANGLAINKLGKLVGVAIIAYRSLQMSLLLDVLETAVEIAPVLPINFVKTTMHLVAVPQSAAAA